MAKGKKTGGRKVGSVNKITADVKEMILEALDKAGGAKYLYEQSIDNPTAFMTLVGKVLPMQMNHSGMIAQTHDEFLKQAQAQLEGEKK